jgi:hypothetical protein
MDEDRDEATDRSTAPAADDPVAALRQLRSARGAIERHLGTRLDLRRTHLDDCTDGYWGLGSVRHERATTVMLFVGTTADEVVALARALTYRHSLVIAAPDGGEVTPDRYLAKGEKIHAFFPTTNDRCVACVLLAPGRRVALTLREAVEGAEDSGRGAR